MHFSFAPFACVLLALSSSASASPTAKGKVLPPSIDPWYTAPSGYQNAAPGDVLRVREAPGLVSNFGNASAVYQLLYRSTDSRYNSSWAVTTLLVPKKTKHTALLSYQIPYNTADVDASPSVLLYGTPAELTLIYTDIQTSLSKGWYVNVPDFEGPLAAFTLGVQAGHAVLDSVRAVLNHESSLASGAKYAMWGSSGGSIATEWAAELQVQYAPELQFAGAAMGGVVSNFSSTALLADSSEFAALLPEGLLGLTAQNPEARQALLAQLHPSGPYNATAFLAAANLSINAAFPVYAYQNVWAYLKDGEAFLSRPMIKDIIDQNGYMGYHGLPTMPMFMYKAINDELTPIGDTDLLVDRFCGVGANILYERNTVGGHLAEETNGDQRAIDWLAKVLGGSYIHQGCTIKDGTWNITDSPV